MSLDQLASISSIIASLAVVISLIFIGLQLRQNSHLTRMAAAQTSAQLLAQNFGRVTEMLILRQSWCAIKRPNPGARLNGFVLQIFSAPRFAIMRFCTCIAVMAFSRRSFGLGLKNA